ncbi:MAG: SDR family oxidoreductase [Longimicrobiales bacterium]
MVIENSTYLVTGGAGFIGSNLVEALIKGGAVVRVLDDFSTGRRSNLAEFEGRFELIEGSITDPATCSAATAGVEYVLHQAAVPSVQKSLEDPLTTHTVGATGTLNVLVAARDNGVQRVVVAGSSSAYGDTPELPKREDMTPSPRSPYAIAKLAGEQYARVFPDLFGMGTVVLRYFNVFGPRQDPDSLYSAVIPLFFRHAVGGTQPFINGDGEQTRDFTYIQNVVQANLRACTAEGPGVLGRVFNVGCGERISINRLWESITSIVGVDLDAIFRDPRPGDVRDSLADITSIQEKLGYEPTVDLNRGLELTLDWFRQSELDDDVETAAPLAFEGRN